MERKPTRRGRGALTIDDVARAAGVSPMTVSRVINSERNVRESTRERVALAIKELGYAPNPAARSLASARNMRFGLLYSNPSAAYLSEFLLGSLDACSRASIQLIVERCETSDEDAAVEHMITSGVDGVILPPPLSEAQSLADRLMAAKLPLVGVAAGRPLPGMAAIRIDDFRAARTMTERLIELGHRRIGFIRGHPNQSASDLRHDGYVAALHAAGLSADSTLVAQGFFTYQSGLAAAEQLFSLAEPPTAIFASNDDMAAATMTVAHRRGLDIPRDVTVCGFDDTALATTVWPPLTTIRQPVSAMAQRAVELLATTLVNLKDGVTQGQGAGVEFAPFQLVVRESDGPPAPSHPQVMDH